MYNIQLQSYSLTKRNNITVACIAYKSMLNVTHNSMLNVTHKSMLNVSYIIGEQ